MIVDIYIYFLVDDSYQFNGELNRTWYTSDVSYIADMSDITDINGIPTEVTDRTDIADTT